MRQAEAVGSGLLRPGNQDRSNDGAVRVIAPNGRVVALSGGQETFAGDRVLVGRDWIQSGNDVLVSSRGPHPMDFGNGFCDAIGPLLNP